jgi:hypothetical protein
MTAGEARRAFKAVILVMGLSAGLSTASGQLAGSMNG